MKNGEKTQTTLSFFLLSWLNVTFIFFVQDAPAGITLSYYKVSHAQSPRQKMGTHFSG
jgi:hypothetical protein